MEAGRTLVDVVRKVIHKGREASSRCAHMPVFTGCGFLKAITDGLTDIPKIRRIGPTNRIFWLIPKGMRWRRIFFGERHILKRLLGFHDGICGFLRVTNSPTLEIAVIWAFSSAFCAEVLPARPI
ncbi:hypothetical protein JK203_14570 [Gluconobacter cerinus]|uniref:hypothetical protein n=1 Tax=Gluconobacter cerinus TaxID=38307 RepID=UPI001B8BDD0F|nr:hypothetical protein [Gluconobacter cerinus]MBS1042058.1 hypothetical protein [Gluconobacter cerinus]MBS1048648.1 hypothetical protein [Gluconobacter cerinus]